MNQETIQRLKQVYDLIQERFNSFSLDSLEVYIGQEIPAERLPSTLEFPELLSAFKSELSRLQDSCGSLKLHIEALKEERQVHLDKYDDALILENFTDQGITEDSHFDLIVIQARSLPSQGAYFIVKSEGNEFFKSLPANNLNPVWNQSVSVPIFSINQTIEIEIQIDRNSIGSLRFALDDYSDQCVHSLWHDISGTKAEIKVAGQWIHNMLKLHEINISNCDIIIEKEKEQRKQVKKRIHKLTTSENKELMREWLVPYQTQSPRKSCLSIVRFQSSDDSTHFATEEEISRISKNMFKVESPRPTRSDCTDVNFFSIALFRQFRYKQYF